MKTDWEAEQILTTPETSAFLKVPQATLRWWRHTGRGPKAFRLGERKVVYKLSDLQRWLDKQYAAGSTSSLTAAASPRRNPTNAHSPIKGFRNGGRDVP